MPESLLKLVMPVAVLMLMILFWCRLNIRRDPELLDQIGQDGHGTAL